MAVWLALTLAASCWDWKQVFVGGEVYFVDPDCYSRMTRVQRVIAAPWKPVTFHDFENAPQGITPHTTAPTDLLLTALEGAIRLGLGMTGIQAGVGSIDLAGVFLSPLLGLALVAFLWWWGRKLKLPYRHAVLAIAAISPILAHGFQLGRPDHQSVLILLVGAALAAEIGIWNQMPSGWEVAAAALWALALWTSLFEPLLLLLATACLRLAVLGRKALPGKAAVIVFVSLLLAVFLFEGWRARVPSEEERAFFFRWARDIGELRRATLLTLCYWTGWLLIASPILLLASYLRTKERTPMALSALLILLSGLSMGHVRWGYFLAMAFALALPWILSSIPRKSVAWLAFLISLWPLAAEWDRQLFPEVSERASLEEDREEAFLLRETAQALVSPHRTIILAPWWLSPALAYWSGQRCVGGSSHESLPGIVDSSRFYSTTVPDEAYEILKRRSVNYVIAYEPARIVSNSSQILDRMPANNPLGKILFEHPDRAPAFLHLVYANRFFKVFEFLDQPDPARSAVP